MNEHMICLDKSSDTVHMSTSNDETRTSPSHALMCSVSDHPP